MQTFLMIAVAGALLAVLAMVWPLLAGRGRAVGRDAADARILRDQLAEIDRDLARGTISADEATGARIEVSRRLIAAAGRAETAEEIGPAPRGLSRAIAALVALGALTLGGGLYAQIGAPDLPDRPLAARSPFDAATSGEGRPSQAEVEAMVADVLPKPAEDARLDEMLDRMRTILAERKDDIRGHRILARALFQAERWVEARVAYDRLVDLTGPGTDADTHAERAEAMMFAANSYVSPEAAQALEAALKIEPGHEMARYYAGFAFRQTGQPELAIRVWQGLLAQDRSAAEPRGPEWQRALHMLIVETRGGPGAAAPAEEAPAAPGPSREQVEAAGQMSADERTAMIETMVGRLDARLSTEGGPPEDWVRLINAYVQLGRIEQARGVLAQSQTALADKGEAGFVRERALLLGVTLERASE